MCIRDSYCIIHAPTVTLLVSSIKITPPFDCKLLYGSKAISDAVLIVTFTMSFSPTEAGLYSFSRVFTFNLYSTPFTILLTRRLFNCNCLLYTSDAADERSSVDLGGR